MKKTIFASAVGLLLSLSSFAQSYYPSYSTQSSRTKTNINSSYQSGYTNPNTRYQSGYYKDNGTYVAPHIKTESNSTNWDNFSTQGNTNPYTNQQGTRARDYSNDAYNYGQGKQIQTGERGGQYYINSNGNKTYVPKQKKW